MSIVLEFSALAGGIRLSGVRPSEGVGDERRQAAVRALSTTYAEIIKPPPVGVG